MSTRGLVHNKPFKFNGTKYDVWKIRMLDYFRIMDPNIEQILDMGFSPPKDPQNLSLEDEKNSYLNALATNELFHALSNVVIASIKHLRNAHEIWTMIQEKYDASNIYEDECSPSTSGRDEFSSSSTDRKSVV